MSVLFDVDPPSTPRIGPPVERVSEKHMLDMLASRYTHITAGAYRYAFASHVPNAPSGPNGIADFIAIDCWKGGYGRTWDHTDWGFPIHGHEVKVSRSDWLTELKTPEKAEVFRPYCDFWWLVVSDASIVRDDLPPGWGLIVKRGERLVAVTKAKRIARQPMPRPMSVALMRAIAKTARLVPVGTAEGDTE